MMLFIICATT